MPRVLILADHPFWFQEAYKLTCSNHLSLPEICLAASKKAEPRLHATIPAPRFDVRQAEVARALAKEYSMVISLHCRTIFHPELVRGTLCVNLHPGLLPHQRGWTPYVFALLRNEPAGACIHLMDEQVDHGPVVVQREVELLPWDTCDTLYQRVREAERAIFWETAPQLVWCTSREELSVESTFPDPQPKPITKAEFEAAKVIDNWRELSAEALMARIRAFTYGDECSAVIRDQGRTIKLSLTLGEEVADVRADHGPGKLGADRAVEEDCSAAAGADHPAKDIRLE